NPIENIINQEADEIFATHKNKKEIEELFVNHLVKINQDESFSKRSEMLNNIPSTLHALVGRFVQKRLLIKDSDKEGQVTVEIVHEALITNWSVLKNWLNKERGFLILKSQLFQALKEWEDTDRKDKALLFGLRLENAIKHKEKLNNKEREYVERSFEYDKKIRRRKSMMVSIFILVVSLLDVYGFWQKGVAEKESFNAKNLLYNGTMEKGFLYRDYLNNPLKAKLIFANAVEQSLNKIQEQDAKIVFNSVNRNINLLNIIDLNSSINGAILSKNEKELLYWNNKGEIKVLNLINNKQKNNLNHNEPIREAMFSKDEKKILSWSDKSVKVWSVTDSKLLYTLYQDKMTKEELISRGISKEEMKSIYYSITGAKFNKNGNRILICTKVDGIIRTGSVKVWDINENKYLFQIDHSRWITEVHFNKDESELLIAGDDSGVTLWNVKKQKLLQGFYHRHLQPIPNVFQHINGAIFVKNEQAILTRGNDGTVRIFNKNDGEELFKVTHDDYRIDGVKFNKQDEMILSWGNDDTIRLWDWDIEDNLEVIRLKHKNVIDVEFSRDKKKILSWNNSNIKLWSIYDTKPLFMLKDENLIGVKLNNNENKLFSWNSKGIIKIWNIKKSRVSTSYEKKYRESSLSNESDKYFLKEEEDLIKIIDKENNELLLTLSNENFLNGINLNKNHILTWSGRDMMVSTVNLWSIGSGKALITLKNQTNVVGAKIINKGKQIFTWNETNEINIYNLYRSRSLNKKYYPLEVQVETGTYLTTLGEVKILSKNEWLKKKEKYEKILAENN
ncbi:WD40 repeat domain-containing protein, partial [Methanocaldococcus sp.]